MFELLDGLVQLVATEIIGPLLMSGYRLFKWLNEPLPEVLEFQEDSQLTDRLDLGEEPPRRAG